MGLITCRNADAPVKRECEFSAITASNNENGSVTVLFTTTYQGSTVTSLGSVCYRLVGSNVWVEAQSTQNGQNTGQHFVNLTPAQGTYEYQVKGVVDGCVCTSEISQFTVDDEVVVPPEGCAFCVDEGVSNVAWEAEAAEIDTLPGVWEIRALTGASGGNALFYDYGNNDLNPQQNDAIKYIVSVGVTGNYKFKARTGGNYGAAADKNNDFWMTHNAGNVSGQPATSGIWRKLYRPFANPPGWAWTGAISPDEGGGEMWLRMEACTKYCITIAGRSGEHAIDKMALCLDGTADPENVSVVPCGECDCGDVVEPPEGINLTPEGKPTATGRFEPCDLISIHYDSAPDPDDIHAAAAGACLMDCYGISSTDRFCVAAGAYGLNNSDDPGTRWDDYNDGIEAVLNAAYGVGGWSKVIGGTDGTFINVATFANKWKATIDAGCDVWVAEGGPSDFTAQVGMAMEAAGCTAAELKRVHVIQHADPGWNANNTLPANLAWVQANLDYQTIDNGNLGAGNNAGGTADLKFPTVTGENSSQTLDTAAFWNKVKAGPCGAAWTEAESAFSNNTVDFSDTVELLYILNISQGTNGTITEIQDFCDAFAS